MAFSIAFLNARTQKNYGCDFHAAIALNGGKPLSAKGAAAELYRQQYRRAKVRGIDWQFTFEQWVEWWEASGIFHLRGRAAGCYVMARHEDAGPYSPTNVFLCTHARNVSEGLKTSPNGKALGEGRGWTYCKRGIRRYQVVLNRKYIGVFSTPEEAEAAYRDAAARQPAAV